MAREKKTHKITVRIPLEDYFKLLKYYGEIAPPIRAMIKKILHQKEKKEVE
ncbi:MAG: hypothetical protein ACTSRS_19025 [Candidatus Helarchaeota archaeon]